MTSCALWGDAAIHSHVTDNATFELRIKILKLTVYKIYSQATLISTHVVSNVSRAFMKRHL